MIKSAPVELQVHKIDLHADGTMDKQSDTDDASGNDDDGDDDDDDGDDDDGDYDDSIRRR